MHICVNISVNSWCRTINFETKRVYLFLKQKPVASYTTSAA